MENFESKINQQKGREKSENKSENKPENKPEDKQEKDKFLKIREFVQHRFNCPATVAAAFLVYYAKEIGDIYNLDVVKKYFDKTPKIEDKFVGFRHNWEIFHETPEN